MMMLVPGTLIYGTLVQLLKKLRENVKSVPYSLGGDAQGHLGLVTSAATYACIDPNAVFTHPAHPDPLVQVTNDTQFQIAKAVCLHR